MFSIAHIVRRHETKARFLVVGAFLTVFSYALFALLDTLFSMAFSRRYVAYMSAMALGNVLTVPVVFVFHKYVTFKSWSGGKSLALEFVRFVSTYLFTWCVGLILLPFFVEILHIHPKLAGALMIPITTVISYIGHSRFSFRH